MRFDPFSSKECQNSKQLVCFWKFSVELHGETWARPVDAPPDFRPRNSNGSPSPGGTPFDLWEFSRCNFRSLIKKELKPELNPCFIQIALAEFLFSRIKPSRIRAQMKHAIAFDFAPFFCGLPFFNDVAAAFNSSSIGMTISAPNELAGNAICQPDVFIAQIECNPVGRRRPGLNEKYDWVPALPSADLDRGIQINGEVYELPPHRLEAFPEHNGGSRRRRAMIEFGGRLGGCLFQLAGKGMPV